MATEEEEVSEEPGINERLTEAARQEMFPSGAGLRIRLLVCQMTGHYRRRGIHPGSSYCLRCGLHEGWTEHGGLHPLVEAFFDQSEEQMFN